ncbi:hypothetical protein TNCV_1781131 [Trichonephila clavipes]|nr:hypothetical protein TNCV_1781131 [Trichonephila clavipes]
MSPPLMHVVNSMLFACFLQGVASTVASKTKLPVRLINTRNGRRLVRGLQTTPLRVKDDIEDISIELNNGGMSRTSWKKRPEFYCSWLQVDDTTTRDTGHTLLQEEDTTIRDIGLELKKMTSEFEEMLKKHTHLADSEKVSIQYGIDILHCSVSQTVERAPLDGRDNSTRGVTAAVAFPARPDMLYWRKRSGYLAGHGRTSYP